MDQDCKRLLSSLSFKEYRLFLQNALGLYYFKTSNHENFTVLSQMKKKLDIGLKDGQKNIFAYIYVGDKLVDYYYLLGNKTDFFYNNRGDSNNPISFFNAVLNDDTICLLLLSSKEKRDYSEILKRDFISLSNTVQNDIFSYGFILGTGVDLPNEDSDGFHVADWGELIKKLGKNITSRMGVNEKELCNIKNKIGNTDYVLPQLSKDTDKNAYFETIYDCLYGSFSLDSIDKRSNRNLEKETLYWIAEVLVAQSLGQNKQSVLTFNYDNFLELILNTSFNILTNSLYRNSKAGQSSEIEILHSHGFLPYNGIASNIESEYRDSIVLSSFEYMDMYEDSHAYSYLRLYNQLHKTNLIIGNSLVDYEEEKVFRNHHKRYLSEYSFILLKKSDIKWLDVYRRVLFLQMGVLPIYFDCYSDIREFLKDQIYPLVRMENEPTNYDPALFV